MISRARHLLSSLLAKSPLVRNSLTLMTGTFASQAILFLFSPVLSRMFALEEFGDLANYSAWTAILALASNLRYEHSIIVAKGRDETYGVIALTSALSLVTTAGLIPLAAWLHFSYAGGGYLAELQRIAVLVPVGVFGIAFTSLFNQHSVKTGEFKRLTVITSLQVVVTIGVQVSLGIAGVRNALIIGTAGGFLFSAIALAYYFFREHHPVELLRKATPGELLHHAKLYQNFPRYTMAADGIAVVSQRFVPVLVLAWFTPVVAGLYAFSIRVVRIPLIMLAYPVVGALRKEAVDRVHAKVSLAPLFLSTTKGLFLVSAAPFLVLALFSEPLFLFVFGPQWGDAGRIVEILSPGILLEFLAIPTAVFFLVTDTQHLTLAVQALGFIALVVALAVGRRFFDDFVGTCYLISAVMIMVNGVALGLARHIAGRPFNEPAAASHHRIETY